MDWDLDRIQSLGVSPLPSPSRQTEVPAKPDESFAETLQKVAKEQRKLNVTFSAHASKRLMQRGITLDRVDLEKIDAAFDKAAEKGAKESLFILKDLALLVSVENRTVITALHGDNAKDNVFTEIDSAVML